MINSQGEVSGVIQIDTSDQRNRFSRDDLEVLASVACQAAIAVENAELHETAVRNQEEAEPRVGTRPRRPARFLPSRAPQIAGYDFFHFYEPANELGGDYYDYIPLPGRRLAVVVADVSGKGIPASLLMARLSADVRYCLASEPSPALAVRTEPRVLFRRLGRSLRDAGLGRARSVASRTDARRRWSSSGLLVSAPAR